MGQKTPVFWPRLTVISLQRYALLHLHKQTQDRINSPDQNSAIRGQENLYQEYIISCDEKKCVSTFQTKRKAFTNNLFSELEI